jgi:hypothetical protein
VIAAALLGYAPGHMSVDRIQDQHELEQAVRRWLDTESVNPATGEAPDAKVAVMAVPITTFGELAAAGAAEQAAADEPTIEQWSVTATLYFPTDDDEHVDAKVLRVTERFEQALPIVLDGGGELTWRGTDRGPHARLDAPAGYETAIDVLLTARPA